MERPLNTEGFTPEELKSRKERTYKLITLLFIIAITMTFVGLISAVVVSMMDKFWLNLKLPSAFTTSTVLVILSSICLFGALFFAKKNKTSLVKLMISLTMLLGISFIACQLRGFKQMIDSGNYVTGDIFFQKGEYGSEYIILKNDQPIEFDGLRFTLNGETLSKTEESELQNFVYPICQEDRKYVSKDYKLDNYGSPYSIAEVSPLSFKYEKLEFVNSSFEKNGLRLLDSDLATLFHFAFGIKNETPFFGVKGEYGEDFTISLNGEVLDLINKKLYFPTKSISQEEIETIEAKHFQGGQEYSIKKGKIYSAGSEVSLSDFYFKDKTSQKDVYVDGDGNWFFLGKELTNGQYNEFYQTANQASSFIYVLFFLHAAHIFLGLSLLTVLLVRTFKGYYNSAHTVGLRMGGIFWHYLGILWVILFTFWSLVSI